MGDVAPFKMFPLVSFNTFYITPFSQTFHEAKQDLDPHCQTCHSRLFPSMVTCSARWSAVSSCRCSDLCPKCGQNPYINRELWLFNCFIRASFAD